MKMRRNVGAVDRIVRLTLAAVIVLIIQRGAVSGVRAVIPGVLTLALTGTIRFCSFHVPFGISTR